MIRFLNWLRSILFAVLNGLAKTVVAILLILVVLLLVALWRGDGHPSNMVLTLDLRQPMADSVAGPQLPFQSRHLTMMDLIFALDSAQRDSRVKGVMVSSANRAWLRNSHELRIFGRGSSR